MSKKTLKNICFSILFFIILLILIELTLRVIFHFIIDYDIEMYKYSTLLKKESSNPNLIFEHIPNSSAHIMGVDIKIDQYGIRNSRKINYSSNNNLKVLCMGSSITFGWGVPEEETYIYKLEDKFKSNNINITFINSGIGNYSTKMIAELLKQNFDKINPDCILLTYFINDSKIVKRQHTNFITKHSYIYAILSINLKKIHYILKYKNKDISYYYENIYNSSIWDTTKNDILNIKNFCTNKKVPLFVIILPDFHEHNNNNLINIYSKITNFMNSNNIPNVNIYDFYNKNFENIWVANNDSHPNIEGHKIISNIIYDFLLKENFVSILKNKKSII